MRKRRLILKLYLLAACFMTFFVTRQFPTPQKCMHEIKQDDKTNLLTKNMPPASKDHLDVPIGSLQRYVETYFPKGTPNLPLAQPQLGGPTKTQTNVKIRVPSDVLLSPLAQPQLDGPLPKDLKIGLPKGVPVMHQQRDVQSDLQPKSMRHTPHVQRQVNEPTRPLQR